MLIRIAQDAFLALLPSGGQGTARANAWGGMVAERSHSRARHQAQSALDAALRRTTVPAAALANAR